MNEASIAGILILTLAVVLVFGATFLDWLKHHSAAATGLEVFAEDPTDNGQVLHCAGDHDIQAIPLGDGRWLHECVRCHLVWRIGPALGEDVDLEELWRRS